MGRRYGCRSMVAPLRRVIVKRPREAFSDEATIAAQWKELGFTAPPDLPEAEKEFSALVCILEQNGTEVLYLPPDDRTTLDSIYTHDPALVTEAGVILFQTGKIARRGEAQAFGDALNGWKIPILGTIDGPATAEGGDMLWLDENTLCVGRGFRTNAAGVNTLCSLLKPLDVEVIDFPLPYWNGPGDVLHLMSFISLLDSDLSVVYRRLLPVPFFELLTSRKVELIDIPENEFATQASNVLALAPRKVVMLEGNPVTKSRLEEAGCTVYTFKGDEIAFKGCGGPTCLTRPLLRDY